MPKRSDEELMLAAGRNDRGAFGLLVERYGATVVRFVQRFLGDVGRDTAEDLAQDVFLKAWKAIKSCRGKERTFSSWLYRIAHNNVIDIFRSQQKKWTVDMETVAELNQPTVEIETELDHKEILNSLRDLPPNQRQVIILKFIEGLDNPEIERIIVDQTD